MTAFALNIIPAAYWTPAAVTQLANVLLVTLITAFLLWQWLTHRNKSDRSFARRWIALTFVGFSLYCLLLLASNLVSLHESLWFRALVAVPGVFALYCYTQFAYRFPRKLSVNRFEYIGISAFLALVVLFEIAVTVWRLNRLDQGYVEFRLDFMDVPIVLGFIWCLLLFIRQILAATPRAAQNSHLRNLGRAIRFIASPFQTSTGHQKEARAFFWISMLPLSFNAVLALRSFHWITSAIPADLIVSWLTIGLLAIFTLNYLNSIAERTTLMIKVVGVTFITLITMISSLAWTLEGAALESYQPQTLVQSETAYRFTPDGNQGYTVTEIEHPPLDDGDALLPHDWSQPYDLPFDFPFYGKTQRQVFARADGIVGFETWFYQRDAFHHQAHSPFIAPVVVTLVPTRDPALLGEHISNPEIVLSEQWVMIEWRDFESPKKPDDIYSFRVRLYQTGDIDIIYDNIPDQSEPDLNNADAHIMLSGLSPGRAASGEAPISWMDGTLSATSGLRPIRQDFILLVREHLDGYFRPLAYALLVTALIILLVYPILFLHMLIRPLGRVMQAIEQVRLGQPTALQSVGRDEISYISVTMNTMSATLHDLVENLEAKAEERAADLTAMAQDNARLSERDRLSAELHDSVAQTLFASNLLSERISEQIKSAPKQAVENVERIKDLNHDALKQIRNLLGDLRPAAVAEAGLCSLLRPVAEKFCVHAGLALNFQAGENARLPEDVQMVFLRVLQECLNNTHKHANATSVEIECDALASQAILVVSDNGEGFHTKQASMGSFGLQIMRDRLKTIAADLDIKSSPGEGTRITVVWFGDSDE